MCGRKGRRALRMTMTDVSPPAGKQQDQALPALVQQALAPAASVEAAQEFARSLAHTHYENFSVVSVLVPKSLRQDFCNVYAFCRIADDLGAELGDPDLSLRSLSRFADQTRACYAGSASSNVFVALSQTIRRHDIPIQPFLDLSDAFEQDQRVT